MWQRVCACVSATGVRSQERRAQRCPDRELRVRVNAAEVMPVLSPDKGQSERERQSSWEQQAARPD